MQVVTIYQSDGIIPGVPASEMRGAGQYLIKGGHVVGFKPVSAPVVPEEEDEGPTLFPMFAVPPAKEETASVADSPPILTERISTINGG